MAPDKRHHDTTHYALLGVGRESSLREIKSAYRKISMKAHPDRGGSNEAQARINHAYEILSDPALRRRYDASLSATDAAARTKPRSGQAGEWEKSFNRNRAGRNIRERVRKEVNEELERIRSARGSRVDAEYERSANAFRKNRSRFIFSMVAAGLFVAAGFVFPPLWAGAAIAGYTLFRTAWFGDGDDAILALNPEWYYILKRRARNKANLESEAMCSRLEEVPETVDQLFAALRKTTSAGDEEPAVLRRILIHFFLLGYGPVSHDAGERIVVISNGHENIAVRYRHRTGSPANATFINRLRGYMGENNIHKGFLYASPGLSKNAARLAEKHGIVHYTTRDLNAWISGTSPGRYPGPEGNIIRHVESFMKFFL